ncbi:Uncharacterized protein DAT39_006977 [Clarias magur]|uniref:Uncharacterized protein n=1 Tax=Clarias magur TaxID=1594786 RepID=A0A8J4UA00_CLAMG|nr:Uncharacterized protein DAT39_006977 [Clarias magur]
MAESTQITLTQRVGRNLHRTVRERSHKVAKNKKRPKVQMVQSQRCAQARREFLKAAANQLLGASPTPNAAQSRNPPLETCSLRLTGSLLSLTGVFSLSVRVVERVRAPGHMCTISTQQ